MSWENYRKKILAFLESNLNWGFMFEMIHTSKIIAILSVVLFLIYSPVSAHETKVAGFLSVLLHMEPNDSPVINVPSQLFLAFTDSRESFDINDCNCRAVIKYKDKIIFEDDLGDADESYGSNVAKIDFTFPKKGIYQIGVSGESKLNNFDSFSLVYDVRIERESLNQAPVSPTSREKININVYIYALGIIGAIAIIIIGMRKPKIN